MTASGLSLALQLPLVHEFYDDPAEHGKLLDVARMAEDAGVDTVIVVDHVVMGTRTDQYLWGEFPFPPETPWPDPIVCCRRWRR